MPAEVFFAHPRNAGTLTRAQLSDALQRAGLAIRVTEDKAEQLWIEFDGLKSRLLTMQTDPLSLITLQVYDDLPTGTTLADQVETALKPYGYIDAEQP